jgi:hypothetical protein
MPTMTKGRSEVDVVRLPLGPFQEWLIVHDAIWGRLELSDQTGIADSRIVRLMAGKDGGRVIRTVSLREVDQALSNAKTNDSIHTLYGDVLSSDAKMLSPHWDDPWPYKVPMHPYAQFSRPEPGDWHLEHDTAMCSTEASEALADWPMDRLGYVWRCSVDGVEMLAECVPSVGTQRTVLMRRLVIV